MRKPWGSAFALVALGAVVGAVLVIAGRTSEPTVSVEAVPAAANNYGPVVFYSGAGEAGVKVADPFSGWEFVAKDSPKYSRWTSDTKCEMSGRAARFPSDRGLTTLVGWSLGRLGPIYFLGTARERWGEIHTIYLFDPGPVAEMECEPTLKPSPQILLRDWLQSGTDRRLVVYAGGATQKDGGEGLRRYYLSAIDGTDAASRVYNCRVDPKIRHDDPFVERFIPTARDGGTCPDGTRQDYPSTRPPLQVVTGGGTPDNLQPAISPQGSSGSAPPTPTTSPVAPLPFAVSGSCSSSGGTLGSSSSGFTPGGRYTIKVFYPDGRPYTNLTAGSEGTVRSDGSVVWNWDCTGDPAGTYATELADQATGRTTRRVPFTIGEARAPATQPPATSPPATQPPATSPSATQAPTTAPPATQAPATAPSTRDGTVNGCNTYGQNCEGNPIYRDLPPPGYDYRTWPKITTVANGSHLAARCWAEGGTTWNYAAAHNPPDFGPNPYESNVYFSVRAPNGEWGWIPDTYFVRDKIGRLGLPRC
jgi:hypothetical protein